MLLKGVFFDLYGTLLIPKNNKKAWKRTNLGDKNGFNKF